MKKKIKAIVSLFPLFADYFEFKKSLINKVSLGQYFLFHFYKKKSVYWPVHKNSEVTHPLNIFVGINSNPGTRPGCYIQGNGGVFIGNYVNFASNIGIISGNHDSYDQSKHITKEVFIGDYSWIGMNAVILPGVTLGPRTIVGAGSVVTKSFPDGFCIIAGNPARVIKFLDKEKFKITTFTSEFYGFVPKNKFKRFARKHLQGHKYINLD